MVSTQRNVTLEESLEAVKNESALIGSLLSRNTSSIEVSNYSLEELDLVELVRNYHTSKKATLESNVKFTIEINPDFKQEGANTKPLLVKANEELLQIGLNAIIENAVMHAFIDPSQDFLLNIRLSYSHFIDLNLEDDQMVKTAIKLEVSNSGESFPTNFSIDQYRRINTFTGPNGNTGIGGYEVDKIIRYHNSGKSSLEISSNDKSSKYSTTISFTIPLI